MSLIWTFLLCRCYSAVVGWGWSDLPPGMSSFSDFLQIQSCEGQCWCFCIRYFEISVSVSLMLPYISTDNKDECHWHAKHAGTCQASRSKVRECGSLSIYSVPLYTGSSQLGFCGTGSCSRQLLKYTEIPLSIHNPRHTGVMLIQLVSFLNWLILSEPFWLKHL